MTYTQIRDKAQEIANSQEWLYKFIEDNNLSKDDRDQIRFKIGCACLDMAEWALSSQWTLVETDVPKTGKIVIAHYETEDEVGECFSIWNGHYWVDGSTNELEGVTKWMHIPKTNN